MSDNPSFTITADSTPEPEQSPTPSRNRKRTAAVSAGVLASGVALVGGSALFLGSANAAPATHANTAVSLPKAVSKAAAAKALARAAAPVAETPGQKAADDFYAKGYTYDDAVALAKTWNLADAWSAKVKGGTELERARPSRSRREALSQRRQRRRPAMRRSRSSSPRATPSTMRSSSARSGTPPTRTRPRSWVAPSSPLARRSRLRPGHPDARPFMSGDSSENPVLLSDRVRARAARAPRLEPPGARRGDRGSGGGSVRRSFHTDSEASLVPGMGHFLHVTLGGRSGTRRVADLLAGRRHHDHGRPGPGVPAGPRLVSGADR